MPACVSDLTVKRSGKTIRACARACVRVSECVVPNQSMLLFPTLTEQSDRGSDLHILSGQVHSNTSCRFLASRFSDRIGLPNIPLFLYTPVLVTVNTQYLFDKRLPFLSLGAQLRLETTRGYC